MLFDYRNVKKKKNFFFFFFFFVVVVVVVVFGTWCENAGCLFWQTQRKLRAPACGRSNNDVGRVLCRCPA